MAKSLARTLAGANDSQAWGQEGFGIHVGGDHEHSVGTVGFGGVEGGIGD